MGVYSEVGASVLLFFLVFGMSATVDVKQLRKAVRNRNALLTGISMQFLILPFLGFCVVNFLNLEAPIGITLLVVTSSPGGSYSNWWCSLFNADLALSVTMTTISTLLSVIMLPVNLVLYATTSYSSAVVKSLDWSALFISLITVIGGIFTGLLCSAKVKSHKFNLMANKLGNLAGISLVVYSVVVSSSNQDAEIWNHSATFYIAIATPCMIGLAVASFMASYFKLEKPERVAVAVECCYQNTGIATSVAINMFQGEELAVAVGVPLFYGICEAVLLAIYCMGAWKAGWTKAPADESFCVVIATSYEVRQAVRQDDNAIEVVLGSPKENGLTDLVFATTEEGYQIDEVSLNSLSTNDTITNVDSQEEHDSDFAYVNQDDVVQPPNESHSDQEGSNSPDVQASRKRGKAYSALVANSPLNDKEAVSGPIHTDVPAIGEDDANSVSSGGSNRLGRAVASLRSRGTGKYTKAMSLVEENHSESVQDEDGYDFVAPSPDPIPASPRVGNSKTEPTSPIPAAGKEID